MTDALGLGSALWLLWTNVTDTLGLGSVLLLWTNVTDALGLGSVL